LITGSPASADIPAWAPGAHIFSTRSSIAVGCKSEQDGSTEITIGAGDRVKLATPPVFDGTLQTPNRVVEVWTIEWHKVLEQKVSSTQIRIRIWTNHQSEPDRILI